MLQDQPFDISSLHAAYADGLDPGNVIDEVYRRIKVADDPGIFLHLIDRDKVLAEVSGLGPFNLTEKPLWGIPFAIKDNIDSSGAPTTAACPEFAYTAGRDAFVVNILRSAGAILIGKTNLDQFATGLVGVRTPYPVPKNALDPEIIPGGSSSGSAIAVARGIVSFALGTDTAGSGRVPAALNGIVGLKPTLGAVSNSGVVPACRTLDTVSIFALTVENAYDVFRVAAEFDPGDPYARQIAPPPPLAPLTPVFRIGVPDATTREFFGDDVQANSFSAALVEIAALGGGIVEIDFTPFFQVAEMLYEGAWIAERIMAAEKLLRDAPDSLHPVTRQIIEGAESLTATDAFRGFYRLQELKRGAMSLVDSVDLLCVPSIPTFYTVSELEADPIGPNSRLGTYTNFVNLMDLCGIAVPVAPRSDGRPGSVTLLAQSGRDGQIAALANALQRQCEGPLGATSWSLPAAVANRPVAGLDEIAIAVVGAHMSGLPLNKELTSRGARFLFAAKTTPSYRFYSLAGGPPFRPGLIRDDTGAAISLEVWALPTQNFGAFIEGVPAPLGIGTLELNDGTQVKGFICECHGVKDAREITSYGGWRAYLESLTQNPPRHQSEA